MITVKFKEWDCIVQFDRYRATNTKSISLFEQETYEPVAVASVCIPEVRINENDVFIKDWSENEGMYQALVDQGIISEAVEYYNIGYVKAPLCRILKQE